MTSRTLQRCALGAAFALVGVAIVEIVLQTGGQPLSPLGWPGLGIVSGALLGGLPAALAGTVVALGYAVQQVATPERFPLFFSSSATILAWIIGLGLAGALCVWVRARLDHLLTAELSLRESEDRFRHLTSLSSHWYWEIDADLRFTRISGAGLAAFGLSEYRLIGKRAQEVSVYKLLSPSAEEFERLRELRRPYRDVRGMFVVEEMPNRYVSIDGDPIFDLAGRFRGYRGVTRDITDKFNAEQVIRDSEARFRALFELSPDAIVVHSGSVVLYVNAAALKLFGAASQEAIVGMEANDLAFPESLPERQERLDYLLANPGASIPFADRKYRRLDGTPVDVEVAAYSYTERGAIRVVLVARDITARKHAEDALRDSEARYRALFELSPDPIVVTNGRIILFANSATIALAHASSTSDIVGKEAMHFVHPDSAPLVRERLGKLLSVPGASVPFMDMKYRDIEGGMLEVEAGAASFSEAGEIRVLISMRDITERKRAEKALASAKERLQRALEGSSLALWETDLRSGKVYLSEGWAELLGEPVGDTYTTVNEISDLVPAEELPELERLSKETMTGLRPFYSVEHRVRTSGGDWKWIRSTGKVSERDESGRALRMTGTNRDITEQKQAELELKSAREHVEQMNVELEDRVRLRTTELEFLVKEMETFNYAVAHDLHTSLGVMSVNAGMLLSDMGEQLTEDARRVLSGIAENAQLTAKLLDDLLEYSRLGREVVERKPVVMRELVSDAWRKLARTKPDRDMSFQADGLPDCIGDQRMLAQLWEILFANAFTYTSTRTHTRIEVGYDAGQSAYFVRDNGVGFDMRHADKLFGLFERLHRDTRFGGTGVGLALAARILRRHGGRIWAEARPGEGATFCFSLSGESAGETPK